MLLHLILSLLNSGHGNPAIHPKKIFSDELMDRKANYLFPEDHSGSKPEEGIQHCPMQRK